MAHVSTTAPAAHPIFHAIAEAFLAIGRTLVAIPEANEKIRQVEILNAMSDEELAKRGLHREDIARHVFAGSLL